MRIRSPLEFVHSIPSRATAILCTFSVPARLMSAEPGFRMRPDDIQGVYVRSDKGEMVPLASLVTVRYSSGADSMDRFNNLPAAKIFGQGAPGVSSGQSIVRLRDALVAGGADGLLAFAANDATLRLDHLTVADNSGFGLLLENKIEMNKVTLPTTCRMQRPAA